MNGPLTGLRVVEFAGLGPAPFCAMMLADHGAEVIRVDRIGGRATITDPAKEFTHRSRKSFGVDLKAAAGVELVRRLCRKSEAVIEGFRPGVMERLGLGPEVLLGDNPRLVYGRMTGWGQDGPYAHTAGHDINYIALSGALHACGRTGNRPTPPLNLVGDFGGGGMMLAFGVLAAILHARATGEGQVVDCAMTEGSALLMTMIYSLRAQGLWEDDRGVNMLDSGSHYYDTYETSDGKFVSVGAIEPQFYRAFLERIGFAEDEDFREQNDAARWPRLKEKLARRFRTRTRDEWCRALEGSDACFAPVMSLEEAPHHPHNRARHSFVEVDGRAQPAPAPRWSRTPSAPPTRMVEGLEQCESLLAELGYSAEEIQSLRAKQVAV
ncbi:MAG TPA: CaiB/BaiF CoA-transferase family protein [Steroidobacteraceae bacterium]|jgi:alpha-methylacyl-CoA racemase|nr:CaiB/BaiF CoA-transferase family protein [Steroidobacteraceae bacterium]